MSMQQLIVNLIGCILEKAKLILEDKLIYLKILQTDLKNVHHRWIWVY